MISVLDASMKSASVSDLQKMGIEVEGLTDDMNEREREKILKNYRRKIANRESAKRSKIRKKAEDAKLLETATTLLADSASMRKTIRYLQKKVDNLHAENVQLRIRLGENDGVVVAPALLTMPEIQPAEIPPPIAAPTFVVKEAQKKRRGMLKVTSDASIATTFGVEAAHVAQQTTLKRFKGLQNTSPTTYDDVKQDKEIFIDGQPDYILESFWQSHATQRQEEQSSPFFMDNFSMYNFQDGEFVEPNPNSLEEPQLF